MPAGGQGQLAAGHPGAVSDLLANVESSLLQLDRPAEACAPALQDGEVRKGGSETATIAGVLLDLDRLLQGLARLLQAAQDHGHRRDVGQRGPLARTVTAGAVDFEHMSPVLARLRVVRAVVGEHAEVVPQGCGFGSIGRVAQDLQAAPETTLRFLRATQPSRHEAERLVHERGLAHVTRTTQRILESLLRLVVFPRGDQHLGELAQQPRAHFLSGRFFFVA